MKEPHAAAIRAYEKAGFRYAGMLRSAGYWAGRRVGDVYMDILPEDFQGPSAVLGLLPGGPPAGSRLPGAAPSDAARQEQD